MISDEIVQKFKALYKKKSGKDLSDQEALDQATILINLVSAVYRPTSKK